MIPAAPFDHQTRESLAALGNVVAICLPDWPCGRSKCRRCRKDAEQAWQNELEAADQAAFLNILFRGSL